jgi:hypothetical protein
LEKVINLVLLLELQIELDKVSLNDGENISEEHFGSGDT